MSENQKKQLESMGLVVLQKSHIVLIFILALFSIGASWGIAQYKITDLETKHEAVKSMNNELQSQLIDMKDSIGELKFNLKRFMEEYKIRYIHIEGN